MRNKNNINKQWFKSKNVRPKLVNVLLERDANGKYRIVRGDVALPVNQYSSDIRRVDARDLAQDIRSKGVFAL
jgi:hypothetical protein